MENGKSYVQLITGNSVTPENLDYRKVHEYLSYVLTGRNGNSLCPFVPEVHRNNGYYLRISSDHPSRQDFEGMINEMVEQFFIVSPSKTHSNQEVDVTTMVVAFTHELAITHSFGKKLENARDHFREQVLSKGLMLSHMSPFHIDPNGHKSYISAVPLLMVRRMHRDDWVFMKSGSEKEVYKLFFQYSDFR